jgi:alpha-galactosidase
MAVDEKLARAMIDESASLGLEMFHIDAGWFRTVGDWRPDPTGAHAILSVYDPAMAPWFCQRYPANWKASEFTGATVCLAQPKAADWCLDRLRTIIRQNKLDLLEHDQTVVTDGCDPPDRGHTHTRSRLDAGYRAAEGYYRIYDTLRQENPNLLFENCVNGGHMIDYGAVRRCHYISITDTYDPLSNRRAFYDATFALPAAMCECYIQHEAALADRGLPQFRFMLRSGMMGWCTIMTDTRRWTAAQHDAARREFALYKESLRPLIRRADLYHVSPRPDGVRWDGIEYFDPSNGRGVMFAYRGTGDEPEHTFVFKGLDPEAQYALSFQDGSAADTAASGRELLGQGLRLRLREPQTSEIVHIQRQ